MIRSIFELFEVNDKEKTYVENILVQFEYHFKNLSE